MTWTSIHDLVREFDLKSDPRNSDQIKQELHERFLKVHPNATAGWQNEEQEALYHRLHKAREWLETPDNRLVIPSGSIVQLSASDLARIVQNPIQGREAQGFASSDVIASQRKEINRTYAFPKMTAATLASICTLLFGVTATAFTSHPAYNFLGRGLLLPMDVSPGTSIELTEKIRSARDLIMYMRSIHRITPVASYAASNRATISQQNVNDSWPLFREKIEDSPEFNIASKDDIYEFEKLNQFANRWRQSDEQGLSLRADKWEREINRADLLVSIHTGIVKRAARPILQDGSEAPHWALYYKNDRSFRVVEVNKLLQSAQDVIKEARVLYEKDYMRRLSIARSRTEAMLLICAALFGTAYIVVAVRERSDQRWIAILATDAGLKYIYTRIASESKDHGHSFSKSAFVAAASRKDIPLILQYIFGRFVDPTIVEPVASNMLSLLEERNAIRRLHFTGTEIVYAINAKESVSTPTFAD